MLLAGALPILSFPAANLEFLAWFGLVPGLLLIVRSPSAREGGIRAWWLGAGYLIAALVLDGAGDRAGGAAGRGRVRRAVGAVRGGRGRLLRPPVSWPRALAALVVVPCCWLVTEWLRSWQALGGPWAVFGVSQWQHPAVLALAAVGGVWLISFALVLANVAIVLVIEVPATADTRRDPAARARAARRGRSAGQRRRRAAGVRAHPGQSRRPPGHDRHGAARHAQQHEPARARVTGADRRAEPGRDAERGTART